MLVLPDKHLKPNKPEMYIQCRLAIVKMPGSILKIFYSEKKS